MTDTTTTVHSDLNAHFGFDVCHCASTTDILTTGTCEFTNWAHTVRVTLDHDAQHVTITRDGATGSITLDGSMLALASDILDSIDDDD